MKERTHYPGNRLPLGRQVELEVGSSPAADDGIEVHEEQWGAVTFQHLFKLRCECGRSWFELELPKFVRCPACHKVGLVSE